MQLGVQSEQGRTLSLSLTQPSYVVLMLMVSIYISLLTLRHSEGSGRMSVLCSVQPEPDKMLWESLSDGETQERASVLTGSRLEESSSLQVRKEG